MNKKLKKWEKTKIAYLDWLIKNQLRKVFSESFKIENFSIWWITKLVDKDIIFNNAWYHQLNSVLNNEKPIAKRKGTSFPFLIAKVVKKEFGKLLLVDGISSVASIPMMTDAWGCDVVASASQKGWMLPPGLAFISFSKSAWDAQKTATMPRFYFDLNQYQSYLEKGQPPYTPAISVMLALDVALQKLLDEGMDHVFTRHANIARLTREGIKKLGLSLFPDESVASDTVTAVEVPIGIDGTSLTKIMREEHNVILAGGQAELTGKIFRIGHMGYCLPSEIEDVLNSLVKTLHKLGFNPE